METNPGNITRIVPYKFEKDNPFIELYFHYNINNKTYLSPQSFGRPDPIVEFADRLKRMGDKEDWKALKTNGAEVKNFRTNLSKRKEGEGIKFWGFGKTVYQEILGYIADQITEISQTQRMVEILLSNTNLEEAGTSYL